VALARSYSRLQQLEQLREDLVNMVVHDMRSPLTVLSGHLTLLKEECTNLGPHAAEDLDAALEGARAIAGLANDLLDVSRLEEGKLPLDVAEHDLGLLAETVRASLRAFQRGRAIELDAQTPAVIACDAGIVRRILENLVSNAIKHTPTGSPVRISVLAHGDRARVAVSDLGPGIPVEARERIFEKFGVVSARRQDRYHSAGLGLAFCKLAVQAHGGRIGVDAGEPSGSTFWFELPRAARTAAPAG
jgi:signal transduction histidine kinase